MFCPNCGKPVPDGAKFCPSCGLGLPPSVPKDAPAPRQALDESKARLAEVANSVADIKIGDVPAVLAEQADKFTDTVVPALAERAKRLKAEAPSLVAEDSATLYEAIKSKSAQMAFAAPTDNPLYQPAPGKESIAKKTFIIGRVYQGLCIALVAFLAVIVLMVVVNPNFSKAVSSIGQAYDYANTLDSTLGTSYKSKLNNSMGQVVFMLLFYAAVVGFSIWVLYRGAKKNFAGERCGCKLMWFFAIYSGLMLLMCIIGGLALGASQFNAITGVTGIDPWLVILASAAIFIVSAGIIWYRRRVYAEVGYISKH